MTSSREDIRFSIDLLDYSKRRIQASGHKFALTVIDIFSRFLWMEKLVGKRPEEVLTAYREIIRRNGNRHPKECTMDAGLEFSGVFQAYLTDNGTTIRMKTGLNSLAVLDRAQQSLRKIIGNLQTGNDKGWSEVIKNAELIYNGRSHDALYGESPDGLTENNEVQYELQKEHGLKIRENQKQHAAKTARLKDRGAYRLPLPKKEWEKIDVAKYSPTVHKAVSFIGGAVVDETSQRHLVKDVLPVGENSESFVTNEELSAASGKREQQISRMRRFANLLKQELRNSGGLMTLNRVIAFLRRQQGFSDTADVYRIPKAGRYVYFLRLFKFEIEGSGPSINVRLAAAAAAPRTARGADVAPRMPRRELPASTQVVFQPDNPKRGGSQAFTRYLIYQDSVTIGEARRKGATSQDLQDDLRRGFAVLS